MARKAISKTPFGQRLTSIREYLGYRERSAFAQFLGVNPETLGGYERGDTSPDLSFLQMYKQRFSVNLDWLISGEGEMFLPATNDKKHDELEKELADIELRLSAFDNVPFNKGSMPDDAREVRKALERIVSTAPNDQIRARADLYLRLLWGDVDASARQELRRGAFVQRLSAAGRRLKSALDQIQWVPPIQIQEAMKALAFTYDISEEDLVEVLNMIRAGYEDKSKN